MDAKIPAGIELTTPPVADVRAALHAVLRSEAFSSSKRCCDFLSYVVEQVLAGSQHELKERTVAVAVFGRAPSYDSHDDAIVRIKASEVRKRLAQYYDGPGRHDAIRISLPKGRYVPVFTTFDHGEPPDLPDAKTSSVDEWAGAEQARNTEERTAASPAFGSNFVANVAAKPVARTSGKLAFTLLFGAVVLVAAGWAWVHGLSKPTFLEQFWAPALHNATPVYLVAAAAPVFVSYAPGETVPKTTQTEYVATNDQFVGQGDMMASHLIASMLRDMHQPYEMKASNAIDVRDLPARTIVLIGYSSTQWQSISKELRFYVDGERAGMITDRGKDTDWYPRNLTKDLHTDEDYAIVSRFLDPGTRAMVVLVSGATQYGTEGAAMLVTNTDLLRNALRDRPPGWESKNLQIVLHMKVIANSPATPEVVATYYW
jgi:hypothetical protein